LEGGTVARERLESSSLLAINPGNNLFALVEVIFVNQMKDQRLTAGRAEIDRLPHGLTGPGAVHPPVGREEEPRMLLESLLLAPIAIDDFPTAHFLTFLGSSFGFAIVVRGAAGSVASVDMVTPLTWVQLRVSA
jgi:hypothetical protein